MSVSSSAALQTFKLLLDRTALTHAELAELEFRRRFRGGAVGPNARLVYLAERVAIETERRQELEYLRLLSTVPRGHVVMRRGVLWGRQGRGLWGLDFQAWLDSGELGGHWLRSTVWVAPKNHFRLHIIRRPDKPDKLRICWEPSGERLLLRVKHPTQGRKTRRFMPGQCWTKIADQDLEVLLGVLHSLSTKKVPLRWRRRYSGLRA